MGFIEIIGGLIVACVGLFFRGSWHKGKAKKEHDRAEHHRKEVTTVTEEKNSLVRIQKLKDEANVKNNEISNDTDSKRVDLGVYND